MIYAVIDTNVFVSAFITHNLDSATAKIVDYMFHGRINPLYNDEIIAEYEEVLSRDHFHISLAKRQTLFEYIRRKGTTAERVISNKIFIDETDRVFYEVTLSKED